MLKVEQNKYTYILTPPIALKGRQKDFPLMRSLFLFFSRITLFSRILYYLQVSKKHIFAEKICNVLKVENC